MHYVFQTAVSGVKELGIIINEFEDWIDSEGAPTVTRRWLGAKD
jgi:hypothetical protein